MADGSVKIEVLLDDSKVSGGVKKVEGRLSGIASTAKRGIATVGKLAGALGLVGLAYKGIDRVKNSLDGAIDRYDTLNNFPRVMQQIGFDAQDSEKAIQRLSDGIQGLPTTLDSVAKTTQRIAVMTGDLDGAVETTLALNNAFIASGASQADAARGLEQYVQMLAKGEVDLQSWRTLQETMGVALNDVAEAFGFAGESAQNDLYEALKSGEITFDEFNNKLIELSNETGGFADRALTASGGIRTAWTNMNTAIVRGVTEIIGAIDEVLKDTPFESIENIIENIGDSAFNFLNGIAQSILNLKDNVGEFSSVVDLIQAAIQAFVDNVPAIIQNLINLFVENYPRMYEQGLNMILQLINGIADSIPQLIEAVVQIISQIIQIIIEMLPLIIDSGITIITALIDGIVTMLPQIIETGIQLLNSIIEGIVNSLPLLVDTAVELVSLAAETILDNLPTIIEAGIDLLNALIEGIVNNLPALIQQALELVIRISGEIIKNLPKIIEAGIEILLALIDGILNMLPKLVQTAITLIIKVAETLIGNLSEIVSAGVDLLLALVDGIISMLPELVTTAIDLILKIAQALIENLPEIIDAGIEIILALIDGLIRAIPDIVGAIPEIVSAISDAFLDVDWADVGKRIISSIASGISGATGRIKNAISDVAGKVRNFLPFSPAKEGPLKDLDKLDFGGPIEDSLKKAIPNVQAELQALLNIGGPETVLATPEPAIIDTGGTYEFTIVSELDGKTIAKETVVFTAEELETLKKRNKRR